MANRAATVRLPYGASNQFALTSAYAAAVSVQVKNGPGVLTRIINNQPNAQPQTINVLDSRDPTFQVGANFRILAQIALTGSQILVVNFPFIHGLVVIPNTSPVTGIVWFVYS